jgi:hypothetical protein
LITVRSILLCGVTLLVGLLIGLFACAATAALLNSFFDLLLFPHSHSLLLRPPIHFKLQPPPNPVSISLPFLRPASAASPSSSSSCLLLNPPSSFQLLSSHCVHSSHFNPHPVSTSFPVSLPSSLVAVPHVVACSQAFPPLLTINPPKLTSAVPRSFQPRRLNLQPA